MLNYDEHVKKIPKRAAFDYFQTTVTKKEVLLEDTDLEEILEEDFRRVSFTNLTRTSQSQLKNS